VVWRTERYGSWPGFDVEVLQDGADADDQALAGEGRGGVYSCRAFFLFLVVVWRVPRPTNLQCLMFYAQICSETSQKCALFAPSTLSHYFTLSKSKSRSELYQKASQNCCKKPIVPLEEGNSMTAKVGYSSHSPNSPLRGYKGVRGSGDGAILTLKQNFAKPFDAGL
jgi:hypothetical protein